MKPTRRDFLRMGLGSSTLLALGPGVPPFWARSVTALASGPPDVRGRVLVVLQLSGGNDGLNTVVPYRDEIYRQRRPTVGVPASSVHKIDDRVGLHPSLGGLAHLLENRQLAIVQSVGHWDPAPGVNRSHFRSMAVWHTGRIETDDAHAQGDFTLLLKDPGWLNRYLGQLHQAKGGDAAAVHISSGLLPQALAGKEYQVPTIISLEQARRRLGLPDGPEARQQRRALDRISSLDRGAPDSHLQFVQRHALITYTNSARIEEILRTSSRTAGDYPEHGLGQRFRLMAQLIKLGLATSIYYTEHDGYDTHISQLASHPRLLQEVGDSLQAFFADLDKAGDGKRVLVLVFSEFGRRLAENGGGGTDHGTAAPVFLTGGGVKAGVHGPYPDLQDLQDGDPKHAIDFRRVYATVLDRWLNCPSEKILGAKLEPLPVLET
jgi:uncharacterized protein (DUF1501 family)